MCYAQADWVLSRLPVMLAHLLCQICRYQFTVPIHGNYWVHWPLPTPLVDGTVRVDPDRFRYGFRPG